jgi:hypothetical protein
MKGNDNLLQEMAPWAHRNIDVYIAPVLWKFLFGKIGFLRKLMLPGAALGLRQL